ncbi:CoA pyrophosphatase [Frankia sp. Ag45/Mut15]|uniref:CoA pyrophosphatase n=1 Tax=Frankia umida TaxID=573489 RepID=A0ABT0JS08_9ACTN|nr:CoA pyrophosphatase [Frankia umida]MCK9874316.1 CoA pyrophosphatase [Frankia umida]
MTAEADGSGTRTEGQERAEGRDGAGGAEVPGWLRALAAGADEALRRGELSWREQESAGARPAAVLVLFGEGPQGPDVLLIERSAGLRRHASQPAFPGGAADETDTSRAETALREAAEEVGVEPAGVQVLTTTSPHYLWASHYLVSITIAWWRTPCEVAPVDLAETSFVSRVPLAELTDPANRLHVRTPSGRTTPAFRVHGLLVWGFTAGILDVLLRLGGFERPWTPAEAVDLPFPPRGPDPADAIATAEATTAVDADGVRPERDPT